MLSSATEEGVRMPVKSDKEAKPAAEIADGAETDDAEEKSDIVEPHAADFEAADDGGSGPAAEDGDRTPAKSDKAAPASRGNR